MVRIWQMIVALVALAFAFPLDKKYPPTGACTGQCEGKLHDPSVVYRGDTDTFYRFSTNGKISIAIAPTISGPWEYQGAALPDGSIIDLPGSDDLWAPDVFESNGTYYLYYSVSMMSSQNSDIGVATSTTMDPGSWVDLGSVGIPNNESYNKIDGNLFQHSAESPFLLNFGSFWGQIFQVPMTNPPLKVNGNIVHLEHNGKGSTEGSYMFQWNGFYYLFFSSGNCCNTLEKGLAPRGEEYHIMVCRSSEASGGFVDQTGKDCLKLTEKQERTPVLASHGDVYAPGGQGVMWDPQQQSTVLYYHYVSKSTGYTMDKFFFGWNKLDFSSGWPVVV